MIVPKVDDEAARRVFADQVGGERGELINLMCDLTYLDAPSAVRAPLRRRVEELLEQHAFEWAALGPLVKDSYFRRGAVEVVRLDAQVLLENAELIAESAPLLRGMIVEKVTVENGDPLEVLRRVLALPVMARLESLTVDVPTVFRETTGAYGEFDFFEQKFADESVATFLRSGLRPAALELSETTAEGMRVLGESGALAGVRALQCAGFLPEVAAWCPRLEVLGLSTGAAPLLGREWPASLRELRLWGADDASVAELSASPLARHIRRLRLGSFHRDLELGGFRSLRALDAWGFERGRALRAALLRGQFTELRELRLSDRCSLDDARAVLRAYGPQLEFLDLSRLRVEGHEDELRSMVAGAVRFGPNVRSTIPLLAGRTEFEPWL
ncbi:MAG: hypothetical protein QM817_22395 [Archangium sp.]